MHNPLDTYIMSREPALKIGDHVRVRGTPATLALELAGRVGQVRAIANPAELAVEPIVMPLLSVPPTVWLPRKEALDRS